MPTRKSTIQPVTQQDVARHCRVSLFTVSLALRGDPRVKSSTAGRICKAAEEIGYDPARTQTARRLALMKQGRRLLHHMIALFLQPNFEESTYHSRLFWGVLNALTEEGFSLLVNNLYMKNPAKSGQVRELPTVFQHGEVDGIIVPEDPNRDPYFQEVLQIATERRLPIMSMIWPGEGCSSVVADDEGGMRQATEHLLELGHRHILYLIQPTHRLSDLRLSGILNTLKTYSLDPLRVLSIQNSYPRWVNPQLIRQGLADAPPNNDPFQHPLLVYLHEHPRITAILAWNDGVALHAWHTLERAGWRVPERISIVGFDDTDPMPDGSGNNLLTSIRVPLRDIGAEAARQLVKRITGVEKQDRQIVLPTELVVRRSTAISLCK